MCYDEGILQAYLDGEVTAAENKDIEKHLKDCTECRGVLKELEDNSSFVNLHLTTYKKQLERVEPDREKNRYGDSVKATGQRENNKPKGVFHLIKKYKKLTAAVAVAACLGVSLSFAPVREAAAELLTLFRVEKIETTSISIEDLNQIQQAFYNTGTELNIRNFGRVENKQVGERRQVSWDEANKILDFEPKVPAYLPDKLKLNDLPTIEPANKIEFTLNVKNVNAVMKQLGGANLLPKGLDGKPFTLSIAQSLHAGAHHGEGANTKSFTLTQTKSPEIKLPESVDAETVRKAILDLPVIPMEVKNKLASLQDWNNTLYIPQPRNGTSKEVKINGSPGVMISEKWGTNRYNNTLLWQADGMLYIINGHNIDADELLKSAESMK